MTFADTPGYVSEHVDRGETTVIVERASLLAAAQHMRDAEGFNFLSDVTATDYLGWGEKGVAGYWGNLYGRDLNEPGSWGFHTLPTPKPARFSVSYQLLALRSQPRRVRLQTWLEDGQTVASVVPVWPAADWFEREVYDLMGITFEGHPNLVRILMSDDWEGHPLRKDYPIGGEPVRFSDAE